MLELYSFIILCPEPLEVSCKKPLHYYRFHTHSFWWCQTLMLSSAQKWSWHIWLLFASYRRIRSTNCSFLSEYFDYCILYIHVQSRSQLILFVTLFESFERYLFIEKSMHYLSVCLELKVLGRWIVSDQSNLSLMKTWRCSFHHPNLKRAWLSDC